jgi:hypothetical protein
MWLRYGGKVWVFRNIENLNLPSIPYPEIQAVDNYPFDSILVSSILEGGRDYYLLYLFMPALEKIYPVVKSMRNTVAGAKLVQKLSKKLKVSQNEVYRMGVVEVAKKYGFIG